MNRVVITGASGFVGPWVCRAFRSRGWNVTAAVRSKEETKLDADRVVEVGDLREFTAWSSLLADAATVVHLAGRAHRMREADEASSIYHPVNVTATARLATAAREHGVGRFVFMSSIKAMGEERATPYTESDAPAPMDAYGVSKLDAEREVQKAAGARMQWIVVRPPMVYGPGGKGNVPRLVRLARMGMRVPLPIAGIRNLRSMIFVGNLAELVVLLATHPKAANEVFLASDGEDVSTPELLRRFAEALDGHLRTFPVPTSLLVGAGRAMGLTEETRRFVGSLVVDTSKAERLLQWVRAFTMHEGLRQTVAHAHRHR